MVTCLGLQVAQHGEHQLQVLAKVTVQDLQFGQPLVLPYLRLCMKEEGFLALVHCAMSQVSRAVGGFTFVDDTDLCVSGPKSSGQTAALMQQSVTTWEGLLWTTGGTLVPKKCFWYLIHIQWDNGRWHYEMARETWAELMVRNMARQRETVPQLEAHEAQ